MSFILSIGAKTKRKECELGDIVAVYDFPPTATERELFECIEVTNVPTEEIREELEKDFDSEKDYPKFKTSTVTLSEKDKEDLTDKNIKKTATLAIIRRIEKKKNSVKPKKVK